MTKAEKDEMVRDWLDHDFTCDWEKLSSQDIRDYYFDDNKFKDFNENGVFCWALEVDRQESDNLLRELNLTLDYCNYFYGATTKEQEAHNRDMKFYEEAGDKARELVDAKVKQFTTKKQWNDFIEWTNTRGLCYFRIYDIFKKKSAKEFLKSVTGVTEILENDKASDYIWNMYLCNSKWHTDDRESDRGLKYAKNAYYFYSELLQYFN